MEPLSRRNFLKTAGLGTAGVLLGVQGLSAKDSSSPQAPKKGAKVRLAAIGIANRGKQIIDEFDRTGLCEFTALCDVDPESKESRESIASHPKAKVFKDFRKLFEEARLANFNEQQLFSYQMSLKDLWDSYSTWKCANQEGLEQGKELGIAEGKTLGIAEGKELGIAEGKTLGIAEGKTLGIAEGKKQIARKMLSMGMSKEAVLEATGLTEEELHGYD